jgi:hypothetical protein
MTGFVAQIRLGREFAFPWAGLSCAQREGCSQGGEVVQDGRPDLKLGDLAVEVAGRDALAQELRAPHLGLSQTS